MCYVGDGQNYLIVSILPGVSSRLRHDDPFPSLIGAQSDGKSLSRLQEWEQRTTVERNRSREHVGVSWDSSVSVVVSELGFREVLEFHGRLRSL